MPFKSKAQERLFREKVSKGEMTEEQFQEWAKDTDYSKLPERTLTKKTSKVQFVGKVKTIK